jgi:hypothetical protein
MRQQNNFINVQVRTVTLAIKDAATADQMAKWNAYLWGVPGYTSSTNDILHSDYIFGDFAATTIPGIKTENGTGITKFTDMLENFAQTGTVISSTIDGWPIGALHWSDGICCEYDPSHAYAAVMAAYQNAITGVQTSNSGLPGSFELSQNYPNPFNPTTTINFTLAKASDVKLAVFNVLGQKVTTLVDTRMNAGQHSVVFDAGKLSSGVYFYKLETANFLSIKKMMVLK